MAAGPLTVLVVKAVNLANLEKFGKIDPYVVVEVQGIVRKTAVIKSELNPVWNETLEFDLKGQLLSENDELHVNVKDKEVVGKDRLVGKATIPIRDVLRADGNLSLDLNLQDANQRPLEGTLTIAVRYRLQTPSAGSEGRVIGDHTDVTDGGNAAALDGDAVVSGGDGADETDAGLGQPGSKTAAGTRVRRIGASSSRARGPLSTKPQDFQIRVKLIEARQLQGSNINPICRVTCYRVKKQTRIIKSTSSPYWGETLFFNYFMSPAELFDQELTFEVFNAKNLRADSLIGSFRCDIGLVYDEPRHVLLNKWLLLSLPGNNAEGARGYLKICATVLGPGDEAPNFSAQKQSDQDDIERNLLRPAGVHMRLATYKLKVFCAEDLPRMDTDFVQGVKRVFGSDDKKELVDPYFVLSFAGVKASTKILYNCDHPEWNQELRVGLHFPSMCEKIKMQLMDWDRVRNDDVISSSVLNTHHVAHAKKDEGFLPMFGPCFINFYGAPREFSAIPTEYDALNEGLGEGVAYRGRVLVELTTVIDEKPLTAVEDILADDVTKVQKFKRRRKFRLHATFFNASMVSATDAPVEFEVSIGNYGNKLDENLPPCVSTTQPTNAVFDGCSYYYLPWADDKPSVSVDCHWEDVLFRLEAVNFFLAILDRLQRSINTLRIGRKGNLPMEELAQLVIAVIDQLIHDCQQPLPIPNKTTQIQNELDSRLRNWRQATLELIVSDAATLRDTATDIDEAIESLEDFVEDLKRLAVEPQNSIPDVVIWMISGDKRIAYYRCPSHRVIWSENPDYRGKLCGSLETIQLNYPGNKRERENKWEIPALLRVKMWLGLEQNEAEWHQLQSEGEIAVYAETYENEVSVMGKWTNKNVPMSRPKWSDENGKMQLNKEDFIPPPGWKWVGDWYVNPELSMMFDKDAGYKFYLEEVYENQSRLPGANWGPAAVAWTDVKGDVAVGKDEIELKPGWEWRDQTWQVDLNRAVDEYGYEYAVEATMGGYGPVEKRYHMSRRRRWVRLRRLVKPVQQSTSQIMKAMSQTEGWEYAPLFTMKFHATERKMDLVRRRRWHRRMVAESTKFVDGVGGCYFQIASKKSKDGTKDKDKETLLDETTLTSPRMFLTCRKPHRYQLRAYIYQARDLLAGDPNGLSDPFLRVCFQNQSQATEVVKDTLNPTWDQTLIFDSVDVYCDPTVVANDPPLVVMEVYDFDIFGKAEFLGRTSTHPVVHLDPSQDTPAVLQWYNIQKGDTYAGELLAAFELFLVDGKEPPFVPPKRGQLYMVPNGVRPQLVRTGIEIMCWGVRNMARYRLLTVKSPSVEIEIGGHVISSTIIKNTDHNPNFNEPLLFLDIMLPKEELYTPPVNIQVRDNRQFGRKPLVGVHTIKSLEAYRCDALQPGDDVDMVTAARAPLKDGQNNGARRRDHVIEIVPPDDNSNLLAKKADASSEKRVPSASAAQSSMIEDAVDWWSKYYASKGEMEKCREYLDMGYDKLQIFPTELEKVLVYNGFGDFCRTFPLSRGKNLDEDDERSTVGEVKALFKIYPLPGDPSEPMPPRILRNLPPSFPVECVVRVYVIRAYDLQPADPNGLADPYIRIKLGKQRKENRDEYVPNSINPIFGKMFEFKTMIPVTKDLIVGIKDYDLVSADDKIGETTIDLENRYLTKYRAIVGLPQTYCLGGPCLWRDSRKPTEILDQFCTTRLHTTPVYESEETVRIGEKVYKLASFEPKKPNHNNLGPSKERLALHVLNTLPASIGLPLVPEHIETRPLYNPLQPGIEQGRLEMWVDIFPVWLGPPGPPVDIKIRTPKKYELRIVIWNTRDVKLDETSITGEQMSDIYVKGWMSGINETQKTDVHYRSLDGEGNFNWRFVFPFDYIPAEQTLVVKKKEHFWSLDETEFRLPPTLMIQIWDNDKFSADDFLGTLELNLQSMPMSAKTARSCTVDMLPAVGKKAGGVKSPKVNLVSLFEQKRIKGFWPCYSDDETTGERQLTGKVEMELELISEEEARQKPVGRARDEPNQHPVLDPPKRPDTSFLWFTSPWKTLKFIVWRHYKWYFIGAILVILLVVFIILFIYAIPGTAAKKMFGVS